jgi:hypothetical protein
VTHLPPQRSPHVGVADTGVAGALQRFCTAVHAAALAATHRTVWVWGVWEDAERLSRSLGLPVGQEGLAPWARWATGPAGALVVDDPQAALAFFRHAFTTPMPPGRFAAVAFEAGGGTDRPNGLPSVFSACTDWGGGWERVPMQIDARKAYDTGTYALLTAYDTTGFWVGPTAHARLLDRYARRPLV